MTSPKTLLLAHRIEPRKQLGQNFLTDPSVCAAIVSRAGIRPEDVVLEIGAGLGGLTIPTARAACRVYALETDARLIGLLKIELQAHNVQNAVVLHQDFLRFDLDAFVDEAGITSPLVVMGNLPYHISSQILVKLIHARRFIDSAVLMFQREMAQRLMASPNTRDYGRLSVMLQYCAEMRSLAKIDAHLFHPKPKIDSEVIRIRFKSDPPHPAADEPFLFQVVKAAFGQRRKTLRNALAGSELHVSSRIASAALEAAGIDPKRRAETLTVAEFVRLSHAVSKKMADSSDNA